MKMLNVGIVGTGMAFERLHYPAFQKLTDRYKIVALCDRDLQKAKEWARRLQLGDDAVYSDVRQMLDRTDLDIVDILVPIELNFEVTEAVAQRWRGQKKGIICEKPLAATFKQALAARELAQKYNVPIMIAENYRYNEENNLIRDLVRTRKIGDVFYFIFNRVVDFPHDMWTNDFTAREWRQHPRFPGGALLDMGVHDIAALHHILGPVEKLQAFGRPQSDDFSPYSVVMVNMRFQSGVIGNYGFFCAGKEMQRPLIGLRIFGSEGMIYLEERECGTVNVALNDGRQEQIPYTPKKGYENELINFHQALTGSEPISVTPEMAYGDMLVIEQILQSIREQQILSGDEGVVYSPLYPPPGEQPTYMQ
ncbi:Gfo/Idh/MocA family protein [Heliophilum fasciatum]|uniref:Putative dehydrogenase n=1 Tax=Heliophilum fasciatum TaxID=35700 RepID=A0A4V2SY81_9FIRM|nr:Gfo/Idh/MocA family oxidoreductase [Heliophilum fasciatum]MCW2276611.1 putative dehydrogenase [Heliophilum fasciatum]TCP69006.1 putative dehydrogenase [Heliophilum fasciatum]